MVNGILTKGDAGGKIWGASQFLRAAIVPFFGPMTAFKAFFAVIVPPFGPMTATLGGEAVVKRMLLMLSPA